MIITLPSEQVRTFLRYAVSIKPNILYPALDCIKVEADGNNLKFTKTNNNIYAVSAYASGQAFDPILIDERAISGLLMVADAPEITLEGQVLKCGQRKINIPVQDPKMYPNTPVPVDGFQALPDDLLTPIKTSSRYYSRLPMVTVMSFIHSDDRGVFASNGQMTYHYAGQAPKLLLNEEVANIVGNLKDVKYSPAGNYDCYFSDAVQYFFIKNECPNWPYEKVLGQMIGTAAFTIQAEELKKFCALVEYTTKQENPVATMSGVGEKLNLIHEDHDFGSGAEDVIFMTANDDVAPFKFNVRTLNLMLGSLPYKEITFTLCAKHYKLTSPEDANYTGILSALQN